MARSLENEIALLEQRHSKGEMTDAEFHAEAAAIMERIKEQPAGMGYISYLILGAICILAVAGTILYYGWTVEDLKEIWRKIVITAGVFITIVVFIFLKLVNAPEFRTLFRRKYGSSRHRP